MKVGDTTLVRKAAKTAGFHVYDRAYNDKRVGGRRIKIWIDLKKLGDFEKAKEILETTFGERLVKVILATEPHTSFSYYIRFCPSIQVFLKG